MISYRHLARYPKVFQTMTGLRLSEFDEVVDDLEARYAAAEEQRRQRPHRQRAIGGGPDHSLSVTDQILLTVIWLRLYPIHEVLADLFSTSDSTVSRVIERVRLCWKPVGATRCVCPIRARNIVANWIKSWRWCRS